MSEPHEVKLGMNVRDKITGLTGIATGRSEWLNGCDRISVQPPAKDDKIPDAFWIDEMNLEIVGTKHPHLKKQPVLTGGPQNDPKPRPSPIR